MSVFIRSKGSRYDNKKVGVWQSKHLHWSGSIRLIETSAKYSALCGRLWSGKSAGGKNGLILDLADLMMLTRVFVLSSVSSPC